MADETFKCLGCGTDKIIKNNFYKSYDSSNSLGIIPYCKNCIKKMSSDDSGSIDLNRFKEMLKKIDRPFLIEYWQSSIESKGNSLGIYFKNLSLKQNRGLTWKDSVFNRNDNLNIENNNNSNQYNKEDDQNLKEAQEELANNTNFIITPEIVRKWGVGYKLDEYRMLEDIYEGMVMSFDIDNRSQEEYLKTACLYQMQNLKAIKEGKAAESQKWGQMFDKYMESGKLKPNQQSDASLGGIQTFSQFYEMIEKNSDKGFIPQFPDIICDDIDYAIFCFINYTRDLLGYDKFALGDVKKMLDYKYTQGQEIIKPKKVDDDNG